MLQESDTSNETLECNRPQLIYIVALYTLQALMNLQMQFYMYDYSFGYLIFPICEIPFNAMRRVTGCFEISSI